MSSHNIAKQLFNAPLALDPGNAGSIKVDRSPLIIALVSATTETRTLPRPTRVGAVAHLYMKTDGGDITLTVTGGYNEDGDTTFTFSDPGQFAEFRSEYDGTNYYWRLTSSYAIGVLTPTEEGFLQGAVAGTGTASKAVVLDSNGATTLPGVLTPLSGEAIKSATAAAITTTRVLTVADSGGTFSVAKTTAYSITLPTPAQGVRFKFVVLDTGANAVTISDGSAHLLGVLSVNNTSVAATGTTLTLAATGSVGDWVEFVGVDATHYLVTGACIAAADITVA